ncbi:MAG: class I SAM-dependent methyltransferase [Candidatus Diapherotrites archaeon]|nr:class I SAM-dependent methyltransferase [Candidatus Diapherotrites archaeon]
MHSVKQVYETYPYPRRWVNSKEDLMNYLDWVLEAIGLEKTWLKDKHILEIGCGTGEIANALSLAGAHVIALDLSKNSLKYAQKLKEKFQTQNLEFINGNALSLPLKENQKFDLVLSLGVLHYTGNTKKAIQLASQHVKSTGYLSVGLYNKIGRLRMRIKRFIVQKLAGNNLEKQMQLGKKLFGYGNTAMHEQVWLADKYAVPVETYHSLKEVTKWFEKNKFEIVNIRPKLKWKSFLKNEINWFFEKRGAFFIVTGKKN